jgi:hypothetical protein
MPKGAPSSSNFGRSILILTPQRALKFTAASIERHHVWLSALSFLSHSAVDMSDITQFPPALSPLPQPESRTASHTSTRPTPPQTATLRRSRIQDSIRVAKGKERPSPGSRRAYTTPVYNTIQEQQGDNSKGEDSAGGGEAAAEAPHVPRTSADTRKRSNTGPRSRPANSLKSYTTTSAKPSLHSLRSRRDSGGEANHLPMNGLLENEHKGGFDSVGKKNQWNSSTYSKNGEGGNFFEAVGTVRMEAFVKDTTFNYLGISKHKPTHGASHGNNQQGRRSTPGNSGLQYETDGPVEKKITRKPTGFRRRDNKRKDGSTFTGISETSVPSLPRSPIGYGISDPFEGF